MTGNIISINYCPVKSLSFQSVESCNIKKDLGISMDRIFAFSRSVDQESAKLMEKNPQQRKLNNFLTLKNTPVLNKYNFIYEQNKLTLKLNQILFSTLIWSINIYYDPDNSFIFDT